MSTWIGWLIAIASTIVCLLLWFRDVRRIMRERMSTVESAAGQLASCRKKSVDTWQGSGFAEVLQRSESIYRQAVDHYNGALNKPWIYLPARLMGYRHIDDVRGRR